MNFNIAICDDEHCQVEYVSGIVSAWAEERGMAVVLSEFPSAEAFLFAYEENRNIDILLLDVEMAQINGIALAGKIRENDSRMQIIFITGYPDFMAEGFEVAALHYLMKPVHRQKLFEVLDRAVKNLGRTERSVLLETERGLLRVSLAEIMAVEAQGHEVLLTLMGGKETAKIGINELTEKLDASFVRCHRSYLVGLRHICRITRTDVILDNGENIPLSRRMYAEVNQKFIAYCKGEL